MRPLAIIVSGVCPTMCVDLRDGLYITTWKRRRETSYTAVI